MVLELKIPHGTDWETIKPIIPVFISYVLSFIIIGIYWGNHHHLLHTVGHVNSRMMWANLHLLFWLSIIPFATAWMGENNFKSITVAVYAGILDLCGFAYFFLLLTVRNSHPHNKALLVPLEKQTRKGTISTIVYTMAIPLAFVHPLISGLMFLSIAIYWWMPDGNIEREMSDER